MPADTTMWYAIGILVVVGVAAYAFVAARRTRLLQEQKSQERAAAMLLALQQEATRAREAADSAIDAATRAVSTAPPATPGALVLPAAQAAAAPVARPVLRERMLSAEQRLVYLVLRSAVPDCFVMAGVRLGDLLEPPPGTQVLTDSPDLEALRIDFLVCSRALEPLAAILVQHDEGADAASDAARIAALREIGLKLLRVRADGLPRPAELRGFVLG